MTERSRISRRTMLQAGTAAALLARPGPARADTPKQGGHFRIGIGDFKTTDSLNPTVAGSKFENNASFQLRNCLVEVGQDGKLRPELAESWDSSADARRWVFKIRRDVTFHNGKSLTAEDVVASIQLHLGETSHSGAKPMLADIDTLSATGPLEVTMLLKHGNVTMPAVLSIPSTVIVPAGTADFTSGIGTGPYVLDRFESGVRMVAKRNPNYWKQGRAHFESVEMIGIKDPSARSSALLAKQIDAYNQVDLKTAPLLARNPAVSLINVPSKAHYAFPMMMDTAPFNDPGVRRALKLAIDREAMVKQVLNGYGVPGNDQPLSSAYSYFNPDIPQTHYDPDQARALLKQAGHDGLTVQIFVSETPFSGATDAAIVFREQAAKAGITIDVVRVPEDSYWHDVWIKKPLCASRWSGRPTEDLMIGGVYTSSAIGAGWNETHMRDPKLDQMVLAARQEVDEATRRQLYGDMQQLIHDDGGALIFAFANSVDATSRAVMHDTVGNDWDLDGARAAERWWFG